MQKRVCSKTHKFKILDPYLYGAAITFISAFNNVYIWMEVYDPFFCCTIEYKFLL